MGLEAPDSANCITCPHPTGLEQDDWEGLLQLAFPKSPSGGSANEQGNGPKVISRGGGGSLASPN